jgi:hypothetical protein
MRSKMHAGPLATLACTMQATKQTSHKRDKPQQTRKQGTKSPVFFGLFGVSHA